MKTPIKVKEAKDIMEECTKAFIILNDEDIAIYNCIFFPYIKDNIQHVDEVFDQIRAYLESSETSVYKIYAYRRFITDDDKNGIYESISNPTELTVDKEYTIEQAIARIKDLHREKWNIHNKYYKALNRMLKWANKRHDRLDRLIEMLDDTFPFFSSYLVKCHKAQIKHEEQNNV